MNIEIYPDQKIHERIMKMMTGPELRLKFLGIEKITYEAHGPFDVWYYKFKKCFSMTLIKISVTFPEL